MKSFLIFRTVKVVTWCFKNIYLTILSVSPGSDSGLNIPIPFNNNTLPRTDSESSGLLLSLFLSFGCGFRLIEFWNECRDLELWVTSVNHLLSRTLSCSVDAS